MNIKVFLAVSLIFLSGSITGYFITVYFDEVRHLKEEESSKQIRSSEKYQFISPLLECEVADGSINARKAHFQSEVEAFTESIKERYGLTEAAMYFRDLSNGPGFNINGDGQFFPASLLKVPVMMAYYRWSETVPELLTTKILYEKPKDFDITQTIIPEQSLVLGEAYTVDELIRRIIVYSDNQALGLLTERLPREKLQDLFSILGVGDDILTDASGRLTVVEYASFFRILFNSSYLSAENSEKALKLLSETSFNDALPAGVPAGTIVAHKFGEAGTTDVERQLHDCGIVYIPNKPYLACIMTRGRDIGGLSSAIRDISQFTYEQVVGKR